jgi:hypothetical protein
MMRGVGVALIVAGCSSSDGGTGGSGMTAGGEPTSEGEAGASGTTAGSSNTITDGGPPFEDPEGACEQSANWLHECGNPVPDDFIATCEWDLAFGKDCHFDCLSDIAGCYSNGGECVSAEEIDECVGYATNWESCLCDDGGGDSSTTTDGSTTTGGATTTGA